MLPQVRHDLPRSGAEDLPQVHGQKIHPVPGAVLFQALCEIHGRHGSVLSGNRRPEPGLALLKRYHPLRQGAGPQRRVPGHAASSGGAVRDGADHAGDQNRHPGAGDAAGSADCENRAGGGGHAEKPGVHLHGKAVHQLLLQKADRRPDDQGVGRCGTDIQFFHRRDSVFLY